MAADNKQQLGAPLLAGQAAPGGADVSLRVPVDNNELPFPDDPNAPKPYNVIAVVGFVSLVILALSIAALDSVWYIGRLNTTPGSTCTQNCVTTTQTYELSINMVKLTTSASASYKDYQQLVLPKTGAVMSAVKAFSIVVLVSALLLTLLMIIAFVDDMRKSVMSSDFGCYVYQHAPRWLATLALVFTIGAILMPLAFTRTFPDDDIMRQTTGGSITCSSGQVDCGTFWADQTNTIGTNDVTDQHRPTDSWWVALVMFLFAVYLTVKVWKNTDIVALRHDRELHERAERAKRRL